MKKTSLYKVYRTIMIITITAFITFIITYTGLYAYIKKDGKLIVLNSEETQDITT